MIHLNVSADKFNFTNRMNSLRLFIVNFQIFMEICPIDVKHGIVAKKCLQPRFVYQKRPVERRLYIFARANSEQEQAGMLLRPSLKTDTLLNALLLLIT